MQVSMSPNSRKGTVAAAELLNKNYEEKTMNPNEYVEKDFEYFTDHNPEDIYIEKRMFDYAIWHKNSIVNDCQSKEKSLSIANEIYRQNRKKIARIFQENDGNYYVCDNALDYLDARGQPHKTKKSAILHAYHLDYTHAIGSGTYWKGIKKIPN